MKLLNRLTVAGLCCLGLFSQGLQAAWCDPPNPSDWNLTFSDEFNSTTFASNKWLKTMRWDMRNNGANGESQYYVDSGIVLDGQNINLTATKKAAGGFPYSSGIICSYGKFSQQYGYFEMRAQMPVGKGIWPAFWLLPDRETWPPEIDILEYLGHQPSIAYFTNHYDDGGYSFDQGTATGTNLSTGFHLYAVEWNKSSITWYLDGVKKFQVTQHVPQEPMYVIANLAVGGNWPGYPDSTTKFPQKYAIDYIRVYQKKPTTTPPTTGGSTGGSTGGTTGGSSGGSTGGSRFKQGRRR